jgi:P-type Mg2+ transporter
MMESSKYWTQPVDLLLEKLKSTTNGISNADASQRLAQYGSNTLKVHRRNTPLLLFLNQFKSPIVLILIFATIMSALLGAWLDATIISFIVFGSALLSFVQEYNAGNAATKLMGTVRVIATILRDGKPQAIPTENVVPGDVITLTAGSLIPADAVLLEVNDLHVNQAVLTGETFPVEKLLGIVDSDGLANQTNTVFMGTSVSNGSGRALVVSTGKATEFGQIAARIESRPPETEFERGIRHLGYLLSEVMFVLVLAIFALNVYFQKPVLDSLLFSVALAVGLTPQLLPAIININLSKGSQRMAKEGVIVRRLNAIENFGSMDVLCMDKTGTLTQGSVQLNSAFDRQGQPSETVFRLAYFNAYFQSGLDNALDKAILSYRTLDIASSAKVGEIPYDFHRKRLSIVYQMGQDITMTTKGALENILEVCSSVQVGNVIRALDATERESVHKQFADWSAQGYRVLGIAFKRVLNNQRRFSHKDECDLTFAGFLLFLDPPKSDAAVTLHDLTALGVSVKVITGDNKLVAVHVLETIGVTTDSILIGSQMAKMPDQALWQIAERTTLFAEVDPNQKERIIVALQKTGHVVGYMGDGINDAPALHAADVGISVNTAVDVARETADFVLLKQDLSVLKHGIIEGRQTFSNTLKYIFMATSANFGNMFSVAGGSLFLPFLPLLPKQILLLNFLTDLPELAIASDNVDSDVIQKPQRWDIGFIRRFMLVFGLLSSIFDYLTFGALLILFSADAELFRTGWFIESILSAVLVVFVLRTRLPFMRTRPGHPLLITTAVVALVTMLLPYTPMAEPLGMQALELPYLMAMIAISLLYFFAAEILKRWFYRRIH